MTHDEIRDAVLSALSDIAPETDPSTLAPRASLREELDIDSMDFLGFVTALHERLGVTIPEADYPEVDCVEGAVAYVEAHAPAAS